MNKADTGLSILFGSVTTRRRLRIERGMAAALVDRLATAGYIEPCDKPFDSAPSGREHRDEPKEAATRNWA